MSSNEEKQHNLARYKESLALTPPSKLPSIDELAAEGLKLLNEEIKPVKKTKLEKTITENNPYALARKQIMDKMEQFERNEILKMENENRKDNNTYRNFVKKTMEIGDEIHYKNNSK